MGWFNQTISHLLSTWGYWAVSIGLLGENAGLPLPGETVLMLASFEAHKRSGLHIQWVILVGIATATIGDNVGFFLGRHYGEPLIRWAKRHLPIDDEDVSTGRGLIRHHGATAVFFARFIFGLRTIFGPVAGSLGMDWKKFLKWNILGAAAWVCAIRFIGYSLANEFKNLLGYLEKASFGIAGALFLTGYLIWRHYKHSHTGG